jgi:hypothetical protein
VQTDTGGAPLVGGKVYTYLAGTTTAAATYTTSAGTTPQANPIVLNAQGLSDNPIWLASSVTMKLVIKDADDVTIRTVDNVLGINDPSAVATDQWITHSGTPTYLSATSFSVAGDQTGTLQVTRRLKTINAGGTIYSSISASSYNAGTGLTTVTVINDSGTLDASLSSVSYGILSTDNPSIPETTIGKTLRTAATAADGLAVLPIQAGTPVASTSGTLVDFTSIPSWAKRVTVMFSGVSTNSTSNILVQIGDAGGIEATGYAGSATQVGGVSVNYTDGFLVTGAIAPASVVNGALTLSLIDSSTNTWVGTGVLGHSDGAQTQLSAGSKALSASLDRVRILMDGGVATFDAGTINVLYE